MVVASLVAVIDLDVKGGATLEKLVLDPAGLGLVYSKVTGPRAFLLEPLLILTNMIHSQIFVTSSMCFLYQ